VALLILWLGDYSGKVQWTLSIFILTSWLGFAFATRGRVVASLRTLSNLLAALREGDYSFRARTSGRSDDALAEVMREVNAFSETLREQRLVALESTALLRGVMEEIDVAVFAFDASERLRLVNRAGEALLARSADALIGRDASELGLGDLIAGEAASTRSIAFPGRTGRWGIRRSAFRQKGLPHTLLVLLDLSRSLREEELRAWQRLVRVLGHELNNSLAPIRSIAGSLETLLDREPPPDDWRDDMGRGLAVIASRAESLGRFMEAYARLARLPQPAPRRVDVRALVEHAAGLETRLPVAIEESRDVTIDVDPDQIEQLLINVIRNAVDAASETGGAVTIGWRATAGELELRVEDEGPGLSNTANLFVPFFTTKPSGSGIGLVLSRQIAEAHGGTFTLENRAGARGCTARLLLPLREHRREHRRDEGASEGASEG
jgi:nitrogen fixation/metabolism regulation signal transduction histidine kinase